MVLAAGTTVRLAAGPAAGRLADRLDAAKLVFAGCAAAAALMALLYLRAQGFWPLFAVGLLQAAALAPLAPLCDALALGAAVPARRDDAGGPGFDYGWVRGAGSAAFIVGLVLSGQVVGYYGIAAVIWLNAVLLAPLPHYVLHGYGSSRLGLWHHPQRPAPSAAASSGCSGCGSSVAWCWSRR